MYDGYNDCNIFALNTTLVGAWFKNGKDYIDVLASQSRTGHQKLYETFIQNGCFSIPMGPRIAAVE